MTKKRFTSAERAGLLVLAAAMVLAVVMTLLNRNRTALREEPAVPEAIDSLIEELTDTAASSPIPPKRTSPQPEARRHLDQQF